MHYNTPMNPNPNTRIIFLGTPDFAVPSLAALHESGPAHGWEIVAVGTQPDRPAGRGQQLALPVIQPASLRKDAAAVASLAALAPDLLVVAAYGQILRPDVLALPTFGCINVHASLLPAWRGASPITAAILDGQEETGVTIMLMDAGMDTGPSLRQARAPILPDDTTASLSVRLAQLGAAVLVETLPHWLAGTLVATPQAELPGEPSVCRLIRKEAGRIDWRRPAVEIERMVRAYSPWPGAYGTWRGEGFKVLAAAVLDDDSTPPEAGRAEPGEVVTTPAGPAVRTGEGLLLLKTVQAAGKRALPAAAFANGAAGFVGGVLG